MNDEIEINNERVQLLTKPDNDVDSSFNSRAAKVEAWNLLNFTWPILFTEILHTFPLFYNITIVGNIGTKEMASTSLAGLLLSFLIISPVNGTMTAFDTLASQAYTSGDKTKVGVFAQTATFLFAIFMVPIYVAVYYFSDILRYIKADPELIDISASYVHAFSFVIPLMILSELMKKFLLVQGIARPSFFISVVTVPLYVLIVNAFVAPDQFNLGLNGIPYALFLFYFLGITLHLVAIKRYGMESWGGFTFKAVENWRVFLEIGIYGALMTAGVTWPSQVISLIVSYFGKEALSAQTILSAFGDMASILYLSVSLGTSVKIGNHIGSKYPNRAKLTTFLGLALVFLISVLVFLMLLVYGENFVAAFTKDPLVIRIASEALSIVAFGQLIFALTSVNGAILRGQGRQNVGAFFKCTAGCLVALPVCFFLTVVLDVRAGLKPIWFAIVASWAYSLIGESIVIINTDWDKLIEKCHQRINPELVQESLSHV